MKPYSKDLRLRVLAAVDRGMPRAEAARIFGVSAPTIRRYLRLRQQTGDVEPKPVPGPPARKGAALEATLPAQVRANPETSRWPSTANSLRSPQGCGSPPPR
jgi:transposase